MSDWLFLSGRFWHEGSFPKEIFTVFDFIWQYHVDLYNCSNARFQGLTVCSRTSGSEVSENSGSAFLPKNEPGHHHH